MKEPGENSLQRRSGIFREYEKVISEYGKQIASKMAKKTIYNDVADRLNYSPEYVRKVVASFLKKGK